MDCPKCKGVMEAITISGTEVDRCTGCHGLFFDAMEAERLRSKPGSEALDDGDPSVGRQQNSNDRIRCPRDSGPMVRVVDPDQPHIHLETCASCGGTFFDAGEFKDYKDHTLVDMLRDWFAKPRN